MSRTVMTHPEMTRYFAELDDNEAEIEDVFAYDMWKNTYTGTYFRILKVTIRNYVPHEAALAECLEDTGRRIEYTVNFLIGNKNMVPVTNEEESAMACLRFV